MANTLRFKRGLASGIPTALAGEPLFTTDTFDLYIGNGTGNTRFQKYIASGTTVQVIRGDGSLYNFPLDILSPSNGQVLKYNGTSWVNDSDAGITGSLTTNYLPKATGATTLVNSLVFDNGTNVGIGTTSPAGKLHLFGAYPELRLEGNNNVSGSGFLSFYRPAGQDGYIQSAGSGLLIVANSNLLLYSNGAETARLTSLNNLHIGTFSSDSGEKLQVTGSGKITGLLGVGGTLSANYPLTLRSQVGDYTKIMDWGTAAGGTWGTMTINTSSAPYQTILNSGAWQFNTNGTQKMLLDASGNLGLGVTPSAWGGLAAIQSAYGVLSGNLQSNILLNAYYDVNTYRYVGTGEAARYRQDAGTHAWFNAPSGTAGNAITFTQAMTLSASGFLGIGATSPEQLIHIKNNSGGTAYALIEGQGRKMYLGQDGTGATIYSDGAAPMWFSTNATERMRITSGGNVLIGSTTDSGEKLQVTGDMKVTGGGLFERTVAATALRTIVAGGGYQLTMTNSASSNYQYGWYIDTNDLTLRNVSSGVNNLIIASTGAATFSSNVISNGYFSSDAYRDSRTQFLIGYQGSNQIRMGSGDTSDFLTFFAGANERLRITSGGNVLVATTTDSGEKLQVTGTAKITGATSIGGTLTAPNIYASSGNVTIEANNWVTNGESTNVSIVTSGTEVARIFTTAENVGGYAGIGFKTLRGGGDGLATRLYISSTGAATFSSSVTAGGNLLLTAGSAASIGAINLIRTGTSPVASRMTFGTDGTGYSFAIGKNVGGTVTDLVTILDSGAATFSSSVTATQLTTTRATTSTNNYLQFTTGGTTNWQIGTPSSQTALSFLDGGVETFRLDTGGIVSLGGNFGIGGATFGTSATRTLAVTSGTAPSTSPADRFQLYSADVVAGNAAPHFRTENGAVIKLYQETTSVGNSIISLGGGNSVLDDTTFDGYTLRQIVKALRNQGILA